MLCVSTCGHHGKPQDRSTVACTVRMLSWTIGTHVAKIANSGVPRGSSCTSWGPAQAFDYLAARLETLLLQFVRVIIGKGFTVLLVGMTPDECAYQPGASSYSFDLTSRKIREVTNNHVTCLALYRPGRHQTRTSALRVFVVHKRGTRGVYSQAVREQPRSEAQLYVHQHQLGGL